MVKKTLLIFVLIMAGGIVFGLVVGSGFPLRDLGRGKYQRVVQELDSAILGAVQSGDYRCCITPPCTMCYLGPNKWNNFTAGTCACADLIAQGKAPCPQCQKETCQGSGSEGSCQLTKNNNE